MFVYIQHKLWSFLSAAFRVEKRSLDWKTLYHTLNDDLIDQESTSIGTIQYGTVSDCLQNEKK